MGLNEGSSFLVSSLLSLLSFSAMQVNERLHSKLHKWHDLAKLAQHFVCPYVRYYYSFGQSFILYFRKVSAHKENVDF